MMNGMTLASIKKNPSLIPLFVFTGVGLVGSMLYVLRLATKSPDVSWNKHTNPEPWNEYKDKQYKFHQPDFHESTKRIKEERPNLTFK